MQSISLPDHVLIEINQVFFRFLWNKQFANTRPSDKVKRSVITNDFDEGGLKMINMQLLQQAILLSWGEELLSQEDSIWKRIALVFLEPLRGKTVFKSKQSFQSSGFYRKSGFLIFFRKKIPAENARIRRPVLWRENPAVV